MGTVKKIGDTYYVEFEARGLKYQQIAGTDEKAAWALLANIEAKIRGGEMGAVVRDAPLAVYFRDLDQYIQRTYPPSTARRLRSAAGHFQGFLKDKYPQNERLSQVTPKLIEEYKFFLLKSGRPVKPWIINFTLLLLRETFEYAVKTGHLNDNPTLHIKLIDDRRVYNKRNKKVEDVLRKGVSVFRLAQMLKMRDVLRAMPFFPFIKDPLV